MSLRAGCGSIDASLIACTHPRWAHSHNFLPVNAGANGRCTAEDHLAESGRCSRGDSRAVLLRLQPAGDVGPAREPAAGIPAARRATHICCTLTRSWACTRQLRRGGALDGALERAPR